MEEALLGLGGLGAAAPFLALLWYKWQVVKTKLREALDFLDDAEAEVQGMVQQFALFDEPASGSEARVMYWRDRRDEAREQMVEAAKEHKKVLRSE